ncbi:MAG: hypothetical protein WC043_09485 [Pseudobdellovibrionaceae bacterium]
MRPTDTYSPASGTYLDGLALREREDDNVDSFADGDAYFLEDLLDLARDRSAYTLDGVSPTAFLESDEDALVWGLSLLCESPLMRAMAYDARFEDWALEVDDIDSDMPITDHQMRIVIIPRGTPSLSALNRNASARSEFLMQLACALRLIWQAMNGAVMRTSLSADDQIFLARLLYCDLDCVMTRMAWELKDTDHAALWRHLISAQGGDLALFASSLWEEDDEAANLPAHFAEMFLFWMHDNQLLGQIDCRTLDQMDERLEKSAESVCGYDLLEPSDVMAASRLPGDISYLAPLARTVLYSEALRHIPDPLNEAHLAQLMEDVGIEAGLNRQSPLVFQDEDLAAKIFPKRLLDTQV